MPDVPYRVDKPWGYELVWARTDRYVGKILHVKAGSRPEPAVPQPEGRDDARAPGRADPPHPARRPSWSRARFKAGETVHIPPRLVHQIEAVVDSDVLEASTPELDDLVRLQDRYGRG